MHVMAQQLNFGSRQKVYITHITPDNVFFMQLNTNEAYALPELSQSIQEAVESGQDLGIVNLEVGDECFALSEADGVWYRAIITDCSGSQFTVYYVDYGNTERLSGKNIRHSSEPYFDNSYQAVQCILSDFSPSTASAELHSVLQTLILNQEMCGIIQSKCSEVSQSVLSSIPCYNVTLFQSEESTISISEGLVTSGLGQFCICGNNVELGKKYSALYMFC